MKMLDRAICQDRGGALIFWCLFAFIGSGFEHSVAKMTLLTLALLHPAAGISWGGWIRNLGLVTVGNMIGGAVLVGMAYCHASAKQSKEPAASAVTELPRITVLGKET
jgi:formate/nitrite transporter FocA (FNT family)